jgi:hypothetical protein
MKKISILVLSIFILLSCGEKKSNSNACALAVEKTSQLLPTASNKSAILQAKMLNSEQSATVYKWGTAYHYIIFQPIKSYKGSFNNDSFVINFETHWKKDSLQGQIATDTLPFIKNNQYILCIDLMKPDSGDYFNTGKTMYLYDLKTFMNENLKGKNDTIQKWIRSKDY